MARRTFLLAGASVLPFAAACNPFQSGTRTTTTVTAQAPQPIDVLPNLIATTRFHVYRIQAAIKANKNKAIAKDLAVLLSDRTAHLDALEQELKRTTGLSPAEPPKNAAAAIKVPSDPVEIMALVRNDAANTQVLLGDAIVDCSPYRATIYASISACLASHRAVTA